DIDLLRVVGPRGETNAQFDYNGNHQVLAETNAVGDVTTFTYDSESRLTSVRTPSLLTTTNIYGAGGRLATTIDIEIGRTNNFIWTNGLVYTHTDERGLTTTNTWDALQRLTGATDSRGSISNRYTFLDLTATKDRLGNWTYFAYNSIRLLTAVTNALTKVTQISYCDCGQLQSITDPLGNQTTLTFDLNGRGIA